MLKRLLTTLFFVGAVLGVTSGANAQYMKITTDNPTDNTKLRASGTTILTITLDTQHDKNGSLQTCNSHTAANGCGASTTSQPLDMYGYTVELKSTGGTVTWGTFSPADAAYTDLQPQSSNSTETEIVQFRPTGSFTAPGLVTIGTVPVTPANAATTSIGLQVGPDAPTGLDPFGFGTGFATECDAFFYPNTYAVGDPADPCGNINGFAGDWFDWDGAGHAAAANSPPTLAQPANVTVNEGAVANNPLSATDPDGNPLTFAKVSGPTYATVTTTTPGTGTATGNVALAPGFSDSGTATVSVSATDPSSASNGKSFTVTVNNVNRPPTLTQPANMTVNEGATADQPITGNDPDGDALTFSKTSGPTYVTITTTNATTGNVHLAPGFSDAGTGSVVARATDTGALFQEKTFTVTVNNVNRAPVLAQPANVTVNEGATANDPLSATDADGQSLTFALVSGPTYATVTTTTPGVGTATGNVALAPGFSDSGTATVSVSASDGAASDGKSFTVTVNNVDRPVVLTAISNMTVQAGTTADQAFSATDPDGDAITFTSTGPAFLTRTDNAQVANTRTGNIHLAPPLGTLGTFAASVTATANGTNSPSSFTITVTAGANRPPVLAQPANVTVNEGATANNPLSATDPDGNPITFAKASGPTYATVTTTTPGTGTATGNVALAPGFSDSGTATVSVSANDGAGGGDGKSFTVTVNNVNRAPVLAQPANVTVNEGATANNPLSATDADGQALTFAKVSGPTYATVTTTTPGTGTATGNVALAPGFSDSGTATVSVSASDGAASDGKSFTVTVNNVNQAPVLAQPANVTVNEGATANNPLSATDADGQALTFAKVSGPTYATVTTTTPGTGTATGNVALAPGFSDSGTATVSVSASDGAASDGKSFTVTVNNVNRAPVLAQPANVTVNEGATANNPLSATDADGQALTFAKVSGPTYATVTTTTPGTGTATGNVALAPGFSDSGTATVSVSASDGAASDGKSFTVTVNNVNQPPVLAQPANQSVAQGGTSDQTITATDADGQALTFAKVTGPTFMTVTTTTPGTGTATGNIHLAAASLETVGTSSASVSATDGTATDTKSLTITVTATNHAPVLAQPANVTVNEGATANNPLSATDADGNPLTFAKVSGPTYATVTTTTPGTGTATGNVALAPGFSDSGTATVSVSATDASSASDGKSFTVTVNNVNRAPVLAQPANVTVNEGATANNPLSATDADGQALTFAKVSGPTYATVTTTTPGTGTATGNVALAPGFSDSGTATVSVSASDGAASDGKSFTVTVNNVNRAPVLAQPANVTVNEGATANNPLSATDADGQALTFAFVSGPTYATVTTTTPGTGTATGNVALAPGFSDSGTATVSVSASDGAASDGKSFTVTVNNVDRPVVLTPLGAMTVQAGTTADQAFSATDPDGDAITFTSTGPAFLTRTDNAQVANTRTGNIHLAPPLGTLGTFAASVTATANGTNSPSNFTITVTAGANRPPVLAQPANVTVNEGATANNPLSATDPDGNPLSFAKVSGPTYATVTTTTPGTGTATGNVALAPGFSDSGTATVSVSASDGSASDGKSFTVTVNNVNRAPVLAQPANVTVNEGATANNPLSATDADGQALTFAKVSGPTYATVTTTTPGTGTATGNVALAPGFSDSGTATVSVSASDGAASDGKSFTVTVNNVNRAPVLAQPANVTVNEGATANNPLSATDADGDALTFAKVSGPTYATVTTTTPGTGTATGNVALAPGFSDSGTATVSVSATDGSGGSDGKSFTVTVNNVNRAPVLAQPANVTVNEGATANNPLSATDADGQALTFAKVSGPTYATVTTTTPGTGTATGNVALAPGFSDSGTATVSVSASDGAASDGKSFTVTVNNVNQPPVLAQPANQSVAQGGTSDQAISATDADGQALTFAKVTGPTFMTVTTTTPGTGTATGNIHLAAATLEPTGTSSASVSATDGTATDTKSLTITVTGVNHAPVLAQPANVTVNEGATANNPLSATDPDGQALTFAKVSGPTYATVTTTTPGTGTATGNVALAPGFSDSGSATVSVSASDGAASDGKSFTVTVNNVNQPPVLAQPANQSVAQGGTSDQAISATDADGQALTFAKVTGPTFMTVTTTTPGTGTATGNIHLAAGSLEPTGTSSASVSATDGTATDTKSLTITVTGVNHAPVLAQPANVTVNEGATANNPLSATDPDGNPLSFAKVSGPTYATVTTTTPGTGTATGNVALAPGFSDSGTATVSVSASDGQASDGKSFTVTVNNVNRAPVLAQPANVTVNEGATANNPLSATDADGQALTFAKVSGPTYATVTTTTPGTGTATGNVALAPGFSDSGTATVSVSASDGAASDGKSFTVTVNNVNRAPVLAQPANVTVNEGATANNPLSATDADGQALTFAKVSGPTYATVTTTTPGTGTATGNVALAPGFSDSGTATVSVSASDGAASDGKSFTVTVNNVNRQPTLNQPANMSVAQGFTADQTIIGSDPDGDALTFAKVSGPTYMTVTTTNATTGNIHLAAGLSEPLGSSSASVSASDGSLSDTKSLTVTVTPTNHAPVLTQPANMTVNEGVTADQPLNATDSDGNPLTFSKSAGPTYATVTTVTPGSGTATGNLHLAPGFSDSGTASVSVLVSDGSLTDSKSLTVTVNNVNRPPTLTQPANMTVNEGATADQALLASDPDGDALTFSKGSGPTFETVVGSNVHLAPGFSDSGTYSSAVNVSDGQGGNDSKSFTITVNNVDRGPVVAAIANQTVAQGSTADVAVSATDADGDVITLSATLPTFAALTSAPAAGTVNGTIHIAPAFSDAAGTYSASVTGSSGSPVLTDTKNFVITVSAGANRPPVLAQPGNMTVDEGLTADQTLNATDPDGNALTFSKVTGPLFLTVSTTSPGTGTAVGNAHLAPGFSDAGVYTAVVRVTDTAGASDQKSFSITVNNINRAPVANAGGPYSGTVGVPVSFNGTGSTDPDGDALTYAWDFGDAGTGTGSSPTHTYVATGTYTVSLTVTDNGTPAMSNTAMTTATITNELPAFAFPFQNGDIKPKSGKPRYCYQVQPVDGDYSNTDVILSSIVMTYNGVSVPAEAGRTVIDSDLNLDGIQEIHVCFTKASLVTLFAGTSSGSHTFSVDISGNLSTGGKFKATLSVVVRGPVNGSDFASASVSPNPLNPQTKLSFATSKPGNVKIDMFDLQGRLVRTIQSSTFMSAGQHDLTIDGRGQGGEKLASGVYFIRGETVDGTFKNAITILK